MAGPTEAEVFAVVRAELLAALPDLDPAGVLPSATPAELGLNSLDRLDLVTAAADRLGLDVPLHRIGAFPDLAALVRVLLARLREVAV